MLSLYPNSTPIQSDPISITTTNASAIPSQFCTISELEYDYTTEIFQFSMHISTPRQCKSHIPFAFGNGKIKSPTPIPKQLNSEMMMMMIARVWRRPGFCMACSRVPFTIFKCSWRVKFNSGYLTGCGLKVPRYDLWIKFPSSKRLTFLLPVT